MRRPLSRLAQVIFGIAAALCLTLHGVTYAQEDAPFSPLAILEAGDFTDLAITGDGTRMLVADTANNTARLYDITALDAPEQVASIPLDGVPLALAPMPDYALAIVEIDGQTDLLEVIAPALFNPRGGWEAFPLLDVPEGTGDLSVEPEGVWGGLAAGSALLVLEFLDPSTVNSIEIELSSTVSAIALTDSLILVATDDQTLTRFELRSGPEVEQAEQVTLDATVTALDVTEDGALAAAALANSTVIVFAPATTGSDIISTISIPAPATHVRLVSAGSSTSLVIGTLDSAEVPIYDLSDPANPQARTSLELNTPLRAMTSHEDILAISGGSQIQLFQLDQ